MAIRAPQTAFLAIHVLARTSGTLSVSQVAIVVVATVAAVVTLEAAVTMVAHLLVLEIQEPGVESTKYPG